MTWLAAENPDRAQIAAIGAHQTREHMLSYARTALYALARQYGVPDAVAEVSAAEAIEAFAAATARRVEAPGVDLVGVEVR